MSSWTTISSVVSPSSLARPVAQRGRTARVATPRPRARGGDPVADLAGRRARRSISISADARRAGGRPRRRRRASRSRRRRRPRAPTAAIQPQRVRARVRRRHARPARDLGVLAGGDERVDVAPPRRAAALITPSLRGGSGWRSIAPECAACQHRAPCRAARPRSSGSPPRCSRGRRRATGRSWRALRRARAASPPARPRRAAPHAARVADRRRLPRGGGDRGQGRQRARARLAARPARADRRGRRRRGRRRRRDRRARPRGRRRPGARAAARRQGARPGRRRARRPRRRCSPSRTPTRRWEPDALRAARRARSPIPAVGYACGQVRFVVGRGHQPGGRRTGATRCGCARRSRRSPRSRRATARSTRCAARPTSRSTR